MEKIGKWAFLGGLAIAVIAGLGFEQTWFGWILALLGLVVGFLNITGEETQGFLLAAIGLMLSATAIRGLPFVGDVLTRIVSNLVVFLAPAVLVVALKALFQTAKQA
jgi:ATP synthase protein I